jgi:hypothetical protein
MAPKKLPSPSPQSRSWQEINKSSASTPPELRLLIMVLFAKVTVAWTTLRAGPALKSVLPIRRLLSIWTDKPLPTRPNTANNASGVWPEFPMVLACKRLPRTTTAWPGDVDWLFSRTPRPPSWLPSSTLSAKVCTERVRGCALRNDESLQCLTVCL